MRRLHVKVWFFRIDAFDKIKTAVERRGTRAICLAKAEIRLTETMRTNPSEICVGGPGNAEDHRTIFFMRKRAPRTDPARELHRRLLEHRRELLPDFN